MRVFSCKRRAGRAVVCKKMHGGVGIEMAAEDRDPVITFIGGVPVATLEGTLKKIDRFEGDVVGLD